VTMRVGNGQHVDVVAVSTLHLRLPSGLILVLNKCYYILALSMNIVSGSRLSRDGYHFESVTNGCSILRMVFYMFMHMFMMVYIFWILNFMLHLSTVWMLRDVSLVMIIPHTRGIVILVMLA
jgi:hypothetical protein